MNINHEMVMKVWHAFTLNMLPKVCWINVLLRYKARTSSELIEHHKAISITQDLTRQLRAQAPLSHLSGPSSAL